MIKNNFFCILALMPFLAVNSKAKANDNFDLDDIKLYDIVKVEQCLDQAYDTVPRANADTAGFSTSIFLEGRNLLDTNFESGGILAENEVDGTGGSGTFVTPGQPLTVFGGMKFTW